MKTALVIALLTTLALRVNAQMDKITDPRRHYYKHEMATVDSSNVMYVFKEHFTADKHPTFFITEDKSFVQHGIFFWKVYYPATNPSDSYLKASDTADLKLNGPSYIGYIDEIKGYGLMYAARGVIGIQYIKDGNIERVFLSKDGAVSTEGGDDVYPENFPKYFSHPNKVKVAKFSLQKLAQMYP